MVSLSNCGQRAESARNLTSTPGRGLESGRADDLGRDAGNNHVGRHVLGHDRTCTDDRAGTNGQPGTIVTPAPSQTLQPIMTDAGIMSARLSGSTPWFSVVTMLPCPIEASTAAATKKAYRSDWQRYAGWAGRRRSPLSAPPPSCCRRTRLPDPLDPARALCRAVH